MAEPTSAAACRRRRRRRCRTSSWTRSSSASRPTTLQALVPPRLRPRLPPPLTRAPPEDASPCSASSTTQETAAAAAGRRWPPSPASPPRPPPPPPPSARPAPPAPAGSTRSTPATAASSSTTRPGASSLPTTCSSSGTPSPTTDELQQPPELPAEDPDLYDPAWNAAVLCAAAAAGCDHLDCRRGPFLVVLVATGISGTAACVYSSEAGAWNGPTYAQPGQAINGRVNLGPSALVGNALYFLFYWGAGILKYNLATQEMSVIPLATAYPSRLVLMAMEGGGLGVAGVDDAALYIWSRKDEDDRWIQSKAIDLKKLLPVDALEDSIYVYGFVDGANVIFILANHVLYSIDLKSSQTIKIDLGVGPMFYNVFPYMSFYTPALGVASIGEEPNAGG
ncbi:hypothetical protein ACP4OV_011862 [Aristida adscensionis]